MRIFNKIAAAMSTLMIVGCAGPQVAENAKRTEMQYKLRLGCEPHNIITRMEGDSLRFALSRDVQPGELYFGPDGAMCRLPGYGETVSTMDFGGSFRTLQRYDFPAECGSQSTPGMYIPCRTLFVHTENNHVTAVTTSQ